MEEIKKLLGDDLFNQVKEKLGDKELIIKTDNLIDKSTGDYIPRAVLNKEKQEQKEKYEAALAQNKKDLAELEKSAKDGKDALAKITEIQDKHAETEKQLKAGFERSKKESAIELGLFKAGAGDFTELLLPQFDIEKVIDVNGKYAGIDEQIKAIKEGKYKNLFGKTVITGKPPVVDVNNPETKTKLTQLQAEYDETVKSFGQSSAQAIGVKNRLYKEQMKSTAQSKPESTE